MPAQIAYAALCLLSLWLGLRWFERANLYHPERAYTLVPNTYGLRSEDVRLKAADGVSLHGWFVPGPRASGKEPVILLLHGNAGNISHRVEKLRLLHAAGASVLLLDYRGYGQSEGRPTEDGTYKDAEAAARHLLGERGVGPGRLFYHGESLGAAVAAELALRLPPAGVILESGFTSTIDMGRVFYPWLPVRWLVRFRYDTLSRMARLKTPVLVMHGPADEIVPYSMGRRLYDAAAGPKTFLELRGGHNDGFLETGPAYTDGIRRFLESRSRAEAASGALR